MAKYESIHGTRVRYLTSDPTLDSSTEGQVWYNSNTGANKVLSQIKAWSSGGNMGTARYTIGSCGSQTAALGFGGYSGAYKADTEEYNGFSWSTGGNLNLARFNPGGAGSQTAALAFGGFINGPPPSPTNATEEYNGSSWTAQNTMPTAVRNPAGSGTQTAGLSSGGNAGPPGVTGVTQEYDGTNWTTSPGSMNVARENATGFGIQTATIVAGGNEPGVNNAEQYNGSTWTAVSNLNSPVYSLASAANGTTSHGITFGGASPAGTGLSQTEEWDGSTWTISPASLAAGKWKLGGAGTASAGLKFAGGPPPSGNVATEEYNSNINAITNATWASGGNTNITRGSGYGFGTLTAGVTGTGEAGPPGLVPAATEEYNGSSWTSGNNYPRQDYLISACGTQTAGLASGGFGPPKSDEANEYDGTNWTAGGDMNVAKFSGGMFGVQTSAIYCGGDGPVPGYVATTELYNGSAWSEVADLPVAKRQFATAGTSTAGLASGGRIGPGSTVGTVDEWDGSSWTSASSLNTARRYLQGWGIQTSALVCGGSPNGSAASALTELYNGTSWSDSANLATARHFSGTSQNQGSNTSGWMANGNDGSTFYNNTEEFTGGTETATASTLTTS